jgi:hypothetical protein
MIRNPHFYLDSDVFIAAKNAYYAFSICHGFWKSLIHHHGKDRVFSIDPVKREILAGRELEDMARWVKNALPTEFFLGTDDKKVGDAYREVMLWVQKT